MIDPQRQFQGGVVEISDYPIVGQFQGGIGIETCECGKALQLASVRLRSAAIARMVAMDSRNRLRHP